MKFRSLKTNEIDVRVGTVGEKGVTLLLYKDARVDMDILDETVGSENWQRRHYAVKDNMYCSVGIKCDNEWVWKDDCGTESNTEKEKGEASDSFKRACVNWGIGRELYTAPRIFVKLETVKHGNSYKLADSIKYIKFSVSEIDVKNGAIVTLKILQKNNKQQGIAYSFGSGDNPTYGEDADTDASGKKHSVTPELNNNQKLQVLYKKDGRNARDEQKRIVAEVERLAGADAKVNDLSDVLFDKLIAALGF